MSLLSPESLVSVLNMVLWIFKATPKKIDPSELNRPLKKILNE